VNVPPRARLDLHLHTDRSDGKHPPGQVLSDLIAARVDVAAITDHDLEPAWPAGPFRHNGRSIHLLHGAEVSASFEGAELHLLVYFPGEMPADYRAFLRKRAAFRAWRHEEVGRRLGLPLVAPPAAWEGQLALTRHHLARALVAAGRVPDHRSAWTGPLSREAAVVPPIEISAAEVIATTTAAGGRVSWAHPPLEEAAAKAPGLAALGLHALEAHRPGIGRVGRDDLARIAHKARLQTTGGSDWHGWHGPLGSFTLPGREASSFLAALGEPPHLASLPA
jgi:predicted metal-dependent phosphoesterase TrpH